MKKPIACYIESEKVRPLYVGKSRKTPGGLVEFVAAKEDAEIIDRGLRVGVVRPYVVTATGRAYGSLEAAAKQAFFSRPEFAIKTVALRISPAIDNEYANRQPQGLPLDKLNAGLCLLTLDEARAVLADAEHNSDRDAFSIGPLDMPVGTWRAYKALAKQAREAIAKAEGGAA